VALEWNGCVKTRSVTTTPFDAWCFFPGGGRDRLILCGGWKPAYPALKPGKSPRISANRRSDLDLPVKEEA
jgi:hypothetical protein